jgi:Predicted integral membrane protein
MNQIQIILISTLFFNRAKFNGGKRMFKNKKDFGEGILFNITNYVFWFFMGNIYFALLNIPLIFIFMTAILSNEINLNSQGFGFVAFICLIPVGPAGTALLSVMGKLVREKDINITKDFFNAYKVNFKQSLFLWTFEILLISVLFIDIRFLISQNSPAIITILLYAAIVFIVFIGFYTLPILSCFYIQSKDVIKLSTYYSFRKFNITFLNLSSFVLAGILILKVSMYFLFFISSIVCYLLMFNLQKTLLEIEKTAIKQVS